MSGGAVESLALLSGGRPLLSVSARRNGAFSPLFMRLTARGRVAARSAIQAPVAGATGFEDGYALTPTRISADAPRTFRFARIGSDRSVTITLPGAEFVMTDFGVDGSGRAVLAGYDGITGSSIAFAARYLPSGQLDTSYGDRGVARLDLPFGATRVVVKRDGRAYFLGGEPWRILALDPAGRALAGFALNEIGRAGTDALPFAFEDGPGNTLLVAGIHRNDGGWMARVGGDGRLDPRFSQDGMLIDRTLQRTYLYGLTRDRRGRIVAVGASSSKVDVTRVSARGRIDRTFGKRGVKRLSFGPVDGVTIIGSLASEVATDDRNRIVIAGEALDDELMTRDDQGTPYPAIARLQG